MRVRMNSDISGTRDGVAWPPRGDTIDLPDDEARHMLGSGLAVTVDDPDFVELDDVHANGDGVVETAALEAPAPTAALTTANGA